MTKTSLSIRFSIYLVQVSVQISQFLKLGHQVYSLYPVFEVQKPIPSLLCVSAGHHGALVREAAEEKRHLRRPRVPPRLDAAQPRGPQRHAHHLGHRQRCAAGLQPAAGMHLSVLECHQTAVLIDLQCVQRSYHTRSVLCHDLLCRPNAGCNILPKHMGADTMCCLSCTHVEHCDGERYMRTIPTPIRPP